MQSTRVGALIAVAVCCIGRAAVAAVPPQAAESSAKCLAPNTNARITWTAPANAVPQSVRVYFRSTNAKAEHFVEMRRDRGSLFTALLPKASGIAEAIDFRIASIGPNESYVTRSNGRLLVTKSCPAVILNPDERKLNSSIIVGVTATGPVVPVGFRCDGIVGQITASGELRSYDACSEIALASMEAIATEHGRVPSGNRISAGGKNAAKSSTATSTSTNGPTSHAETSGFQVGPLHHRTQRRAPQPAQPPQPRLQEPVSQSRP